MELVRTDMPLENISQKWKLVMRRDGGKAIEEIGNFYL